MAGHRSCSFGDCSCCKGSSIAAAFGVPDTHVTMPSWSFNSRKNLPELAFQIFALLQVEAVSTCWSLDTKAVVVTSPSCSSNLHRRSPVSVHQICIVRSSLVSTCRLVDEKSAGFNANLPCALPVVSLHWPDSVLQTFMTHMQSAVKILSQSDPRKKELFYSLPNVFV